MGARATAVKQWDLKTVAIIVSILVGAGTIGVVPRCSDLARAEDVAKNTASVEALMTVIHETLLAVQANQIEIEHLKDHGRTLK